MAIVGIQFTKMNIEKLAPPTGKIGVKNNISIKNVSEAALGLSGAKQDVIKFEFEFVTEFEPSIAKILLAGELFYADKAEQTSKIVEEWKKSKKIAKEIMTPVLNAMLSRCNIESILLSKEMNLPAPVPLPKVTVK